MPDFFHYITEYGDIWNSRISCGKKCWEVDCTQATFQPFEKCHNHKKLGRVEWEYGLEHDCCEHLPESHSSYQASEESLESTWLWTYTQLYHIGQ